VCGRPRRLSKPSLRREKKRLAPASASLGTLSRGASANPGFAPRGCSVTFDGECLELNDQYSIGDAAREGPQTILGAALASAQSGALVVPCLPIPKARTRFGGLSPSQGALLPRLSYWDDAKPLPRSNMGGCVGFLVGQYGSHKTGTAIMLALDAIQRHGARVLFIAAEDANGVAKTRLPAACKARGTKLADIDAHWRTETETFDLLSETDRNEIIQAYREFAPDLIFIDVLTRVVVADINAPETGMRVMQAVYALAAPFGATVVIAHHPGLNSSGRPLGSSLFTSLADFCLSASHKDGVVSTKVEKMKNGPDNFTARYKTQLVTLVDPSGLLIEAPAVRAMTAADLEEHKAKRVPLADVAAENATDGAAVLPCSSGAKTQGRRRSYLKL
jgi:AAA domain